MVKRNKILRFVILLFIFLFTIGVLKDYTDSDAIIFSVAFAVSILVHLFLNNRKQKPQVYHSINNSESFDAKDIIKQSEHEANRPYKFIFTHEESVLDAIESKIASHVKVSEVFQDTGYWYSNGETGPEWFSMHVRCRAEDSDEVQQFIRDLLKEKGFAYQINFMGSYN